MYNKNLRLEQNDYICERIRFRDVINIILEK